MTHKDAKTGAVAIWNPSLQEFTDANHAKAVSTAFSERELAHRIFHSGNVATVFSSY